jgi:hypothetical protein
MGQVLLFSLTASLNPTLVAATTLMLMLPDPKRLMFGYLLGAMMTSITIGMVIVFALHNAGTVRTTQHTINPVVDIALGALSLVIAAVLGTGRDQPVRERRHEKQVGKAPPRWQRELSKGSARTTFVVGALLTLPGASYLAGLHQIDKLDYAVVPTVLLVIGFNVIMLALLEVPLICFVVAPDWTPGAVERAKAWASRRARRAATVMSLLVGVTLVLKGIIGLVS